MIALRKIFGRDDRFFNLLEASAEEARRSMRSLSPLLRGTGEAEAGGPFAAARRAGKGLQQEISEHVIRSFVTSLEREDIEALSSALHRIVKHADKIAARFQLCREELREFDFGDYASALERAADHVLAVVKDLRRGRNIEHIEAHMARLAEIERRADDCLMALLREIHRRPSDLKKILVLRDLCRFLERIVDRCVDVGEIVTQIVLKNT